MGKDNEMGKEYKEEELLRNLKAEYEKPEMSPEQVEALQAKMEEARNANNRKRTHQWNAKKGFRYAAVLAAACAAAFVILPNTSASVAYAMGQIPVLGSLVQIVTFRDYQYETERKKANIEIPEIQIQAQTENRTENVEVQGKIQRTADEINAEIKKIAEEQIANFEANMKEEMGYLDVVVKSEVLATTQDYFTLKLICYQGAGSGYQWNYYYTIDLNTGERLQLKDIFKAGADYITPISENIKEQMAEQMKGDEGKIYWLNDEIEEWNFKTITDETSFYLNEKGNVVIGFDEGDVAPMYMGTVEFEIPAAVLAGIRK